MDRVRLWENDLSSIHTSFTVIVHMQQFQVQCCCVLLKAVPLKLPKGGTCNKQRPSFPLHSPTSHLPFHRLPAASSAPPHPCPPRLLLFPSLSPYFIFTLSNCLLWKLMQHPLLHTHTLHTARKHAVTYTNWLTKKGLKESAQTRRRRDENFFLWLTETVIVFRGNIRAMKQSLLSSCSLRYIWRSNVYIFFIVLWYNLTPGQIFD